MNIYNEQEIIPHSRFPDNEKDLAKSYWSEISFESYTVNQPWSEFLADRITSLQPSRVFEFGCNAGKNLLAIQKVDPSIKLYGVDINAKAVEHGQQSHLSLAVADEAVLRLMPEGCFDVCFTVSVLDHLPNPGPTLAELGRIAKKAVVLLEPWLGEEGKVVKNFNIQKNEIIDTTPFSYSWDYPALGRQYLDGWELSVEPYPLNSNLGRYYNLYLFKKVTTQPPQSELC